MRARSPQALGAVLLLTAAVAGCGGASEQGTSGAKPTPEQGFLQAMVPHHTSAIEMAKVAEDDAEAGFVERLADDITTSQSAEIQKMKRLHERLVGSPLKPDMGGHLALGLSSEEAGMDHMDGAEMLRGEKPFDRAFVDEMIPHHAGAIRMAEAVGRRTRDPELRQLARDIVTAQKREIAGMNAFRQREYGGPSPAAAMPMHGGHGE